MRRSAKAEVLKREPNRRERRAERAKTRKATRKLQVLLEAQAKRAFLASKGEYTFTEKDSSVEKLLREQGITGFTITPGDAKSDA